MTKILKGEMIGVNGTGYDIWIENLKCYVYPKGTDVLRKLRVGAEFDVVQIESEVFSIDGQLYQKEGQAGIL